MPSESKFRFETSGGVPCDVFSVYPGASCVFTTAQPSTKPYCCRMVHYSIGGSGPSRSVEVERAIRWVSCLTPVDYELAREIVELEDAWRSVGSVVGWSRAS